MKEDWLYEEWADRLIHDSGLETEEEATWRFSLTGDDAAALIETARRLAEVVLGSSPQDALLYGPPLELQVATRTAAAAATPTEDRPDYDPGLEY